VFCFVLFVFLLPVLSSYLEEGLFPSPPPLFSHSQQTRFPPKRSLGSLVQVQKWGVAPPPSSFLPPFSDLSLGGGGTVVPPSTVTHPGSVGLINAPSSHLSPVKILQPVSLMTWKDSQSIRRISAGLLAQAAYSAPIQYDVLG
jgi:hypothetical protein